MSASIRTLLRVLPISVALALPWVAAEVFLRSRFGDTPYVPGPRLLAVQSQLALHPDVGFLWKGDIDVSDGVLLPWNDQIVEPLSTDPDGFRNHPRAIAWRSEGRRVNVIGLGDSFVHDAAYRFHDLFGQRGLFYYNMAMHRHSPPQYNRILEAYAVPQRPDWVVYGVFENDFREAIDFEQWRASGLDWFSYHSGSWAGPPVGASAWLRGVRRLLPGAYGFTRSLTSASRRRREQGRWEQEIPGNVVSYVLSGAEIARAHGIRLLLVLIPGKTTVLSGTSDESRLVDRLIDGLDGADLSILDLRSTFADPGRNPESLYYRIDAHWNAEGMRVAGEAILEALAGAPDGELGRGSDQGFAPDSPQRDVLQAPKPSNMADISDSDRPTVKVQGRYSNRTRVSPAGSATARKL